MAEVAAAVDDIDDHLDVPGAIEFRPDYTTGEVTGLGFVCPCGCGREGWLPFTPEPSPSWAWNGDRQKPTLAPSVQQVSGCGWHVWLRNGVWVLA